MNRWPGQRLKHLVDISFSSVDKKFLEGQRSVRLCNYTDVYYRDKIDSSIDFMEATAADDQVRRFELRRGDVIITKDSEAADDIAVASYVAEDLPGVLCGYHLALLRPSSVDGRFLYWAMVSEPIRRQAEVLASGVTRYGLRADSVGDFEIPVPPLDTQRAVADFLDRETARVDALVARKRAMARIFRERFRVRVCTAFAGGDSPIRIGNPRPLRTAAEVRLGRQRTPEQDRGPHMVRYLRAANVKDGELDLTDVKEMNFDPAEQIVFGLSPGDVLVSEGSGSLAAVGASAVWNRELQGVVCFQNTLLRLRPRRSIDPTFLAWWCRYAFTSGLFASVAGGANIYHLGADRVRALPFNAPSIADQRRVTDRLANEERASRRVVESIDNQIQLLTERRQALVTAAVTGQLNVA